MPYAYESVCGWWPATTLLFIFIYQVLRRFGMKGAFIFIFLSESISYVVNSSRGFGSSQTGGL